MVPPQLYVPVIGFHACGGPSRAIPFHDVRTGEATGSKRLASAGPVGAAPAGMHRLAQVLADERICLGDPGERPANGLTDRYPGAFALAGEGTGPPAQPGGAG
jgi:hypothetical protein